MDSRASQPDIPKLARVVKNCRDLPGSELFQSIDEAGERHRVDSADVNDHLREILVRQFDIAWKLTGYHLDGLSTAECLWCPREIGLHVHRGQDGRWYGDWPQKEGYDVGPPSIAWLTWHIEFWWSMVLGHSFGTRALVREGVAWPGDADGVAWVDIELTKNAAEMGHARFLHAARLRSASP